MSHSVWPLSALVVLSALACQDAAQDRGPSTKAAPAAATAAPAAASALELRDHRGGLVLKISAKSGGGYRLEDGAGNKLGKISLDSDRVKVKDSSDTLRAKVKKKDNGFKLYAGDDTVVLKGKLSGEQSLKITQGEDERIAKLEGAVGEVRGKKVQAQVVPGGVSVSVDGQPMWTVQGALAVEPALLLALDGLDLYQQAALLIFVKEVW